MEKIIAYAPILITRALAGDPTAIALLAAAGISIGAKVIKDNI